MLSLGWGPPRVRPPALCLTLAAALLAACSGPADPRGSAGGVMLSLEDVLARPPARELPGPVQVWAAEDAPDLSVYYVRSAARQVGASQPAAAAMRIVLLRGNAEVRVGSVVKKAAAGTYAVVPAGEIWSLRRFGGEPLVFSLLASPGAAPGPDLLVGAP